MQPRERLGRFIAAARGAVAIEFALGFPIFLLMIYALFEFSRVFWSLATIEYAVEEAARYAMVNPTANDIANTAIAAMTGLDTSAVNVTASVANGLANVTATYTYSPMITFPGLGINDQTLTATISINTAAN